MTERILGESGSRKRRWRLLLLPVLAMVAATVFFVGGAGAVHRPWLFELDSNATNTATPGDDWSNLYNGGGQPATTVPSNFDAFTFVPDGLGTTGDITYWTGGGSRDRNDIPQWLWGANDQSPEERPRERVRGRLPPGRRLRPQSCDAC